MLRTMPVVSAAAVALSMAAYADTIKGSGQFTQRINPLPCGPRTEGATLHEEIFADGVKLQILCQGGEYRQKITLKDGTVGWTGKCPYTHGRNRITKDFSGNLVIVTAPPNQGIHYEDTSLVRTSWTSFDAPAPPDPRKPTRKTEWKPAADSEWEWDSAKPKKLKQSRTRHEGRWVPDKYSVEGYRYEYRNVRKSGSPETDLPGTPGKLQFASIDLPPRGERRMAAVRPEYAFATPAPIEAAVNGKPATVAIRLRELDGTPEVRQVFAIEGRAFHFDLAFPDESAERVRYSLVDGPPGMTVGEKDGKVAWTPGTGTAANPPAKISIAVEYIEQSKRVVEFHLPVYAQDAPTPPHLVGPPSPVFRSALFSGTVKDVAFSEDAIRLEVNAAVGALLILDLPRTFAPLERELEFGFSVEGDYSVSIEGKPLKHQELEYAGDRRRLRIPLPAGMGLGVSVSTEKPEAAGQPSTP